MDFDAPATAQLQQEIIKPRWYGWLDILGDPVRATTGPANVTFSGTADPDLNGQTFEAWHPDLVDVSEVKLAQGGGGTVTASLSGLIINDNALLNVIGNPANWQGRIARFWVGVHDQAGTQQGAVVPYYGGFMSSLEIEGNPTTNGEPGTQRISVVVESFTASWSRGSGRTYMDQEKYDPLDLSAAAALAAANGGTGNALTGGGGGGTGSGSQGGAVGRGLGGIFGFSA
jgi:hypothetical protein